VGISARLHFQTCNKGRATKVTGAAYGSGRTRTWERAADAETHQHSQHTLCAHRGEQQREKREKIVTGPRQVVTVPSRRAGRALRSSRVECPGGPSGSQVHLRACMPMPGAAAGAQAEAGAPVRVLACKGAFLSLPLSASPCLSSVFFCLSVSPGPSHTWILLEPRPQAAGGGQPPRPDPELLRPAVRAPGDALQGTLVAPAPPRSTYHTLGPECPGCIECPAPPAPRDAPRAPSGRLPRPATPMTHECLACPECPALLA